MSEDSIYFAWLSYKRIDRKTGDIAAYVFRCLPGNLVASGATEDEADARLRSLVDAHIKFHDGSAKDWWSAAKSRMSDSDRAKFGEVFASVPSFDHVHPTGTTLKVPTYGVVRSDSTETLALGGPVVGYA